MSKFKAGDKVVYIDQEQYGTHVYEVSSHTGDRVYYVTGSWDFEEDLKLAPEESGFKYNRVGGDSYQIDCNGKTIKYTEIEKFNIAREVLKSLDIKHCAYKVSTLPYS